MANLANITSSASTLLALLVALGAALAALGPTSQPRPAALLAAARNPSGRGTTAARTAPAGRKARSGGARSSGGSTGGRARGKAAAQPDQPAVNPVSGTEKLAPGQLREQVRAYLAAHAGQELSPVQVAKGLGRSSGAVGNALHTLAEQGIAKQTSDRPRRFTIAEPAGATRRKPATPATKPAGARKLANGKRAAAPAGTPAPASAGAERASNSDRPANGGTKAAAATAKAGDGGKGGTPAPKQVRAKASAS